MDKVRGDFEKWHKDKMLTISDSYNGDRQKLIEKMYEKTELGYYADREVQISWSTYHEVVAQLSRCDTQIQVR